MKFYFTYSSDPRFPFQSGWTEIEAPDMTMAYAVFRHYYPDRDPNVRCLNCADVYTEEDFNGTIMSFQANYKDRCHERITLLLTRERLDEEAAEYREYIEKVLATAFPDYDKACDRIIRKRRTG